MLERKQQSQPPGEGLAFHTAEHDWSTDFQAKINYPGRARNNRKWEIKIQVAHKQLKSLVLTHRGSMGQGTAVSLVLDRALQDLQGFVRHCSFTNLVQGKACKASEGRSSDQPRAGQQIKHNHHTPVSRTPRVKSQTSPNAQGHDGIFQELATPPSGWG